MNRLQRFCNIKKAFDTQFYDDLGVNTLLLEEENIDIITFIIKPHEGFHKNIDYKVKLYFYDIHNWPLIYINSDIYDKIKTSQYIKNKGSRGNHKGICIKNLSYGYNFTSNFKKICDNKWDIYVYYVITFFNNIQDIEKGTGIKSNYKSILNI